MAEKRKKPATFTLETGGEFADTFEKFQKIAAKKQRSAAAQIRYLIAACVEAEEKVAV